MREHLKATQFKKAPRKLVQVASCMSSNGSYLVLGLCSDGTLWQLSGAYEGKPSWETYPVPPGCEAEPRVPDPGVAAPPYEFSNPG